METVTAMKFLLCLSVASLCLNKPILTSFFVFKWFLYCLLYIEAAIFDMDVMGYTVIEEETLPSFLKGKPQVIVCLTLAAALLVVTALSITIGIFIGYTYCYLEHRSGVVKANLTRTVRIVPMPESQDNRTRTINDAIVNNYFISKLLRLSGIRGEPTFTKLEYKEEQPQAAA